MSPEGERGETPDVRFAMDGKPAPGFEPGTPSLRGRAAFRGLLRIVGALGSDEPEAAIRCRAGGGPICGLPRGGRCPPLAHRAYASAFRGCCRTNPNRANGSRPPHGSTIRATSLSFQHEFVLRAARPGTPIAIGASLGVLVVRTLCATSSARSSKRRRRSSSRL